MAHRLDAAGALVDVAGPVRSGRVVASFEYEGSKTGTTAAGQHELWKPTFPVKKGHLYWIVGSVTMRWAEKGIAELVVWRSVANVELQKVRFGGDRDPSDMLTTHSVFVNGMFVAEADGNEPLWVVCNTPADASAVGTRAMWLYDNPVDYGPNARIQHHIYAIDMGPADALVPDYVGGHRLDNAGALVAVPAASPPLVADYASRQHVVGTAGDQTQIMGLTWDAKADHHYLVIALFTAVLDPDNDYTRDYWMYDAAHTRNPIRTRIGTFGGPSNNKEQARPVALVSVIAGGGDVQIWGNRVAGDGDWLTLDAQHRMMVLDLGPR